MNVVPRHRRPEPRGIAAAPSPRLRIEPRLVTLLFVIATVVSSGNVRAEFILGGTCERADDRWGAFLFEFRGDPAGGTTEPNDSPVALPRNPAYRPDVTSSILPAPGSGTSSGTGSSSNGSNFLGPAHTWSDQFALRLEPSGRLRIARLLIPPDPDPLELLDVPKCPPTRLHGRDDCVFNS